MRERSVPVGADMGLGCGNPRAIASLRTGEVVLDLGSGGGFPGLVVAILAADTGNPANTTLVESDQRKAAFLRTVLRETGVSARVIAGRIEDIAPLDADVLSARALADLSTLLAHAERHLAAGGLNGLLGPRPGHARQRARKHEGQAGQHQDGGMHQQGVKHHIGQKNDRKQIIGNLSYWVFPTCCFPSPPRNLPN